MQQIPKIKLRYLARDDYDTEYHQNAESNARLNLTTAPAGHPDTVNDNLDDDEDSQEDWAPPPAKYARRTRR
ncbi:hypothetical protein KCV07_g2910, partial [Aureobasidium melanogenum]